MDENYYFGEFYAKFNPAKIYPLKVMNFLNFTGKPLNEGKLEEAVQITEVMHYGNDFLLPEKRNSYQQCLSDIVTENNYVQSYL